MYLILMTTLSYKALLLQGEIWCWSLLGLKRLKWHRDSDLLALMLQEDYSTEQHHHSENYYGDIISVWLWNS